MPNNLPEETIDFIFCLIDKDDEDNHNMFLTWRYVNKQFARILIPRVFRVINLKPFLSPFKHNYFQDSLEFFFVHDHIALCVQKLVIWGPSKSRGGFKSDTRGVLTSTTLSRFLSMFLHLQALQLIDLIFSTTEIYLDNTIRDHPSSFTSLVLSNVDLDSASLYSQQSPFFPPSLRDFTVTFTMWPTLLQAAYEEYRTHPLSITSACTHTSAATQLFSTLNQLKHLHVYHHDSKHEPQVVVAITNNEATLETLSICMDENCA